MAHEDSIDDHTFGDHWYDKGREFLQNLRNPENQPPPDAQSFNRNDPTALDFLKDEETISADSGTSDILYVDPEDTVTATATTKGADSVQVEYSTAPVKEIKAGDADFVAWEHGEVSDGASTEIQESITAIRLTATAGAGEAKLRARH